MEKNAMFDVVPIGTIMERAGHYPDWTNWKQPPEPETSHASHKWPPTAAQVQLCLMLRSLLHFSLYLLL